MNKKIRSTLSSMFSQKEIDKKKNNLTKISLFDQRSSAWTVFFFTKDTAKNIQ